MAQLFAALQGGRVAGDTSRQIATRREAAAAPISAEQESVSGGTWLVAALARTVDGVIDVGRDATVAVAVATPSFPGAEVTVLDEGPQADRARIDAIVSMIVLRRRIFALQLHGRSEAFRVLDLRASSGKAQERPVVMALCSA
jgi:hypothetical protein